VRFHDNLVPSAQKVLGIDPSTKSIAYCLLDGTQIVATGDEELAGSELYERMQNAYRVGEELLKLEPDFVAIESAVYVNNRKTVIKMAYFYGILMGMFANAGILFDDVPPITWESWIGNPPTRKAERTRFKKKNPSMSAYKIKKHFREERKQRTIDWVKERYDFDTDNDNIADAIAIATYGREVLTNGKD